MNTDVIGWSLGPGRTEESFDFLTPRAVGVKVGEFVHYDHEDDKILCRVTQRDRVESSDETIDAMSSYIPDDDLDVFRSSHGHRVTARILGKYDESFGSFQNLRSPPSIGQDIHMTSDSFLSSVISPEKEMGTLRVGSLLNRPGDAVEIDVDMDEIATKHLSVLASTGAGKSYTVGVLLEEMSKPHNRASSVVFDIHAEYSTLAEDERYGDSFNHIDDPKIKISSLGVEDFDVAFPEEMTSLQRERLRELLRTLDIGDPSKSDPWRDRVRTNYSVGDMIEKLNPSDELDASVAWRLESLLDFHSLRTEEETPIEDLCEPGKCNIVEFPSGAGKLERNLILWHFTRRILEARKRSMRKKRHSSGIDEVDIIDVPVTLFIEEAHNFAPSDRQLKTRGLLQEIAREGRKFGVGLSVISQRPSRLDEDVLSQCNSSVVMKVRNGVDQDAIERTVESAGEDLIRDLPGLTTGQAVLAGSFINTPVLVGIRQRETEHGGVTPDVAEESVSAYESQSQTQPQSRSQTESDPRGGSSPSSRSKER
ncbi:MAG: ATP-binding protein [Halobacteria archaeon]|nr:ATP-binding protein [Halobacteria archaeon]